MQIKKIIRCQVVYILLVVLFVLAVIFNINTGNVHISPARIFRIIFLHGDMGTPEYNIIWKIRLPRLCMAAWYFVRCKDVCCNHDDFSAEIYVRYAAVGAGRSRICRFASCHALCPAFCKPREKYVYASRRGNYD